MPLFLILFIYFFSPTKFKAELPPVIIFGAEDRPTLPGQMELAKVFAVNMTLVHKSLLLRFGRNLNNTTVQFNICMDCGQ